MAQQNDGLGAGAAKRDYTPTQFAERKRYVADLVTENYTHDLLPVDDYERIIQQVQEARSMDSLDAVVKDLPAKIMDAEGSATTAADGRAADNADRSAPWSMMDMPRMPGMPGMRHMPGMPGVFSGSMTPSICFMSGRDLKGDQLSARQQLSINVMGGTKMDFRQTRLQPGETVINVFCLMGGIDIIVPPGLAVRSSVVPIMGGVDIKGNVKSVPGPGEPYLTIVGLCLMGGVDVKVKS